jgi:hypothetical protein
VNGVRRLVADKGDAVLYLSRTVEDLELVDAALRLGGPSLGICRYALVDSVVIANKGRCLVVNVDGEIDRDIQDYIDGATCALVVVVDRRSHDFKTSTMYKMIYQGPALSWWVPNERGRGKRSLPQWRWVVESIDKQ